MIDIDSIKPEVAKLAEKYCLSLVLLFGSQATGHVHKESDVDVAYMSDAKKSFDDEAMINYELTEIFRNDRVDLVNIKNASPLLLMHTVKKAVILYERTPHLYNSLFAHALKTYEEAKPLFDLRRHYLNNRIKGYQHA